MTKEAIKLSKLFETIVMLRPVMRVCHAREICEVTQNHEFTPQSANFQKNATRWAAVPRATRYPQGVEQLKRVVELENYNYENYIKPKLKELKNRKILAITSGVADGYVKECVGELNLDVDILKIDMPYPLPKQKIEKLFKNYEKVIIFEETYPCIEEQLSSPKIHGKLTDDVHKIDEFTKEKVLNTFIKLSVFKEKNRYDNRPYEEKLPPRQPNLCPGCPHRNLFYAIKKTFRDKSSIFSSDIGCYTLGLNQKAIDSYLCMGASISMASGYSIAHPEKITVATLGDSTFLHSGIAPLVNAVAQNHRFILIIMDNSTTAMTGRQTTPEVLNPSKINIKKIVEGCGVECIEYVYTPNIKETIAFTKKLKKTYEESTSPIVAVFKEFCILDKTRSTEFLPKIYSQVNQDKCTTCNVCMTEYSCPAFFYNENNKVDIDPFLCVGCSACIDGLCPTNAFEEVKRGES
jgi:indolepyruvate ferredoxin oxidoreductase alpha subunit